GLAVTVSFQCLAPGSGPFGTAVRESTRFCSSARHQPLAGACPSRTRAPRARTRRSVVEGRARLLEPRAAALGFETPLDRGLGRLRGRPLPRHAERLAQLADEPLERELAVPRLAPLVLRDRTQDWTCSRNDAAPLRVGEGVRALHVEDGLDARLAF